MKKIVCFKIILVLASSLFVFPIGTKCSEESKRTVTFAMMLPSSLLGKGSVTIWDNLTRVKEITEQVSGYDIRITSHNNWNDVIDHLKDGSADFAWLPPYYYAREKFRYKNTGLEPFVIYEANGSVQSRACIYMLENNAGTDGSDKLDALFGKKIAFPDESNWALLNSIFHESNYMFEPFYFFRSFRVLNRESATLALIFNDLDAVVMDELSMKYMLKMDARLSNTVPVTCTDPFPNTMIVKSNHVPSEVSEKIRDIFINLHSSSDFIQFRGYFKLTEGKWIPADGIDLSKWHRLYRKSTLSGWDKVFYTLPNSD